MNKIYSPDELKELLKDSHFADIRMLDSSEKTVVPWKSKLKTLEERTSAIFKFLNSPNTEDGTYQIQYGSRLDHQIIYVFKNIYKASCRRNCYFSN